MIKVVIVLLIIVLLTLIGFLAYFFIQKTKKEKEEEIFLKSQILENKGLDAKKSVFVNNNIMLALNRTGTILTYIENYNDEIRFKSCEIVTKLITKIEKINNSIKIYYLKQGEKCVLDLFPYNSETQDFVYKVYKNSCISKLKEKYRQNNLAIATSSDWKCSYVWVYDPKNSDFIYYKTTDKQSMHKINLKKSVFALDTKYNYFEASISSTRQQLYIYEQNFLKQVYSSLLEDLKARTIEISKDLIYFDKYSDFVYIINSANTDSIRSVDLNKVSDIYYEPTRIILNQYDDETPIKINTDSFLVKEFEDFIMGYNLNKISKSFDYNFDKVINATQYTKFIIDFTKSRCIYCANLNSLSRFTYLTIAFSNLSYVSVEKMGQLPFVRITTLDNETLDVTCSKPEVADYINAQLRIILQK